MRTSAYLKGLIETRKRASADVIRLQNLLDEVGAALATARKECESCDTLILRFDPKLKPEGIQPTMAWRGTYGRRGDRKAFIVDTLRRAYPEPRTTVEVLATVVQQFELNFPTDKARQAYGRQIRKQLVRLVLEGAADALHQRSTRGGREMGLWVYVPPGTQVVSPEAQAQSAGVAVASAYEDE